MKKCILFVDDEPNILQGLQRALRPLRHEWDMAFVGSGPEALDLLVTSPFDVIVSDMRMPGMDGAQLLTAVMHLHPEIVRIALSGQSSREAVLRAIGLTHQYLSKPCDPGTLKAMVARTSALREVVTNTTLKGLVSGMKSLPSLSSLFSEVVEALRSSDTSVQQVSQIIAKDGELSAKILQLVNSACFGLRHRVNDLSQAIALLGLDTIKSLVLALHLFSQYDQTKLKSLSLHTLWDHSFATSACARLIAWVEKQEQHVIDAAFTAALLHDCGQLVLAANLPESYSTLLALAQDQGLPLWQVEHEILGITHAEVGAYLLRLWGLPDTIVETLAFHHRPAHCLEQTFGALTAVHVADALAHEHQTADTGPSLAPLELDYLARLGLTDRLPVWRAYYTTLLQGGGSR